MSICSKPGRICAGRVHLGTVIACTGWVQRISHPLERSIVELNMMRDVEIPILGLLENMSYFVCPETGSHHEKFGRSHPERMASELGMPFPGCLPIDPTIASLCDRGKVESYPGDLFGPIAKKIIELAPVASAPKVPKKASWPDFTFCVQYDLRQ